MKNRFEVRGEVTVIYCSINQRSYLAGEETHEVLMDTEDWDRIHSQTKNQLLFVHPPRESGVSYSVPVAAFRTHSQRRPLHRMVLLGEKEDRRVIRFLSENSLDCRKANLVFSRDRQGRMSTEDLESLYVEYRPLLMRVVTRYLHRFSAYVQVRMLVEDLVQEVFLNIAYRADITALSPNETRNLLIASAYNLAISKWRTEHLIVPLAEVVGAAEDNDEVSYEPNSNTYHMRHDYSHKTEFTEIEEEEGLSFIRAVLPEPTFRLLYQAYVDNIPQKEMAVQENLPYNTLKTNLSRHRQLARTLLSQRLAS